MPDKHGNMLLSEYAAINYAMVTYCGSCRSGKRTPCSEVVERFGPDQTWDSLEKRLRCKTHGTPFRISFQPLDPHNTPRGSGTTKNGPGPGQ